MDADLAQSVIDDAFEALGAAGCTYTPPSGDPVVDIPLIVHIKTGEHLQGGVSFSRGAFETNARAVAVICRASDVETPVVGGEFAVGAVTYQIGEAPSWDDAHGLTWRCRCERLS